MIINGDSYRQLNTSFSVVHNAAYDAYVPQGERLAMQTDSTGPQQTLVWLEDMGSGLVEKTADNEWRGFGVSNYTVVNKEFEEKRAVPQAHIEDDTYGIFTPKLAEIGQLARAHPDKMLFDLLANGFTEKDYTDSPFFGVDKKHYKSLGNAAGNKFTNKLTSQFHAASFGVARKMLLEIKRPHTKKEHAYPYNLVRKLVLVHSPEITETVRQVLKAKLVTQGGDQVWQGEAECLETTFLDGPAWFLLDVGGYMKPLVHQRRIPLQFFTLNNPAQTQLLAGGDLRFKNRKRDACSYGLPQLAVGSTGEDAE